MTIQNRSILLLSMMILTTGKYHYRRDFYLSTMDICTRLECVMRKHSYPCFLFNPT